MADSPAPTTATAAPAAPANTGAPDTSTQPTPAAPPSLYEVKINGKVEKWPLERLQAEAQKSYASQELFQKAAQERKAVESFLSRFGDDDEARDAFIAEKLGMDPADFYRKQFARHLQAKMLTPEQRAMQEREKQLREREAHLKREEEKRQAERMEVLRQEYGKRYDEQLGSAFKEARLPINPWTVMKAAEVAKDFVERGLEPDFRVVAQMVEEDLYGGAFSSLDEADDEFLEKRLSAKVRARLRKLDLKKLSPASAAAPASKKSSPREVLDKAREEAPKQMTWEERRDYLEELKRKGNG